MTEEERQNLRDKYKNKPTSELITDLLVLIVKLILAIIHHALVLILKALVWCAKKIGEGFTHLGEWWRSNDTQEKKDKIIAACKQGANDFGVWCRDVAWVNIKKYTIIGSKFAWKYFKIGCKLFLKYFLLTIIAIWHGLIWVSVTTKDLIIHSKPTFIRLGKQIKQGFIDFGHWIVRVGRGFKLRHIRRKRAWKNFRRNKGFKGLMVDMRNGLSNSIKSYMTEEENEPDPEAITEDDIIAEKIEERDGGKNTFGKKFFNGMKDIVEEKDE